MKKITLTFAIILMCISLIAQPPEKFKYQAVVRDNTGNILANQNVSFKISILQGDAPGYAVYEELHDTVTNQFGLVSFDIGTGSVDLGVFENIAWGEDSYFMQVEMDANGGTNYEFMNKNQLVTVPYAMNASSLTLTDENGNSYTVGVDTAGNLITNLIYEWTTCGDTLTDPRDGQKYATVLIGSQCWMAKNLNIGTRIDGGETQDDDGIIEKYCYNDYEDSCDVYGGLYQWDELMQYTQIPGTQGICIDGWHVPTDHEWKVLEGMTDSQFGVGDPEWDNVVWRGFDIGLNLKSTSGWIENGNGQDLFGFNALPGGMRQVNGDFTYVGYDSYFWTSTIYDVNKALGRLLNAPEEKIWRYHPYKNEGFTVRCIKDYTNQPPAQPSNPIPGHESMDIGIDTVLSWSCSDPDGNDLFYKIHFGTDPTPAYDTAGLTENLYDPGILDYNTTYYWQVVAFDSYGDSSVSSVWSFDTKIMNIPCPGIPSFTYGGQTYTTVQIGTQCWMAENLNIGTRINGAGDQTNNAILEKYCYNDQESNCDTYGGLYQWEEMMQYSYSLPAQGICPTGWHLPTDGEWCTFTQYIDGTVNCNTMGWSGSDVGIKIKSTSGWFSNGNGTNVSGFTAVPSGYFDVPANNFVLQEKSTNFWSSSKNITNDASWYWNARYSNNDIFRYEGEWNYGFSVRCLKD